jgi:hypothetical protein
MIDGKTIVILNFKTAQCMDEQKVYLYDWESGSFLVSGKSGFHQQNRVVPLGPHFISEGLEFDIPFVKDYSKNITLSNVILETMLIHWNTFCDIDDFFDKSLQDLDKRFSDSHLYSDAPYLKEESEKRFKELKNRILTRRKAKLRMLNYVETKLKEDGFHIQSVSIPHRIAKNLILPKLSQRNYLIKQLLKWIVEDKFESKPRGFKDADWEAKKQELIKMVEIRLRDKFGCEIKVTNECV